MIKDKKKVKDTYLDPWEIMPDGMARGYPGDSELIRHRYRTPGAIFRDAEANGQDPKEAIAKWLRNQRLSGD